MERYSKVAINLTDASYIKKKTNENNTNVRA